jgi:isopenicillin N synthase-like dioxygenase
VALEYLKSSTKLVRKLVEILIGKLEVTLDDSRMNALMGLKMVNMNFYPMCPNPELTVGVGRHSDMGTLTVLLQDGTTKNYNFGHLQFAACTITVHVANC